jgi:hypothetical protein
MSESTVLAQVKTLLDDVSGIGAVHDYERFSRSPAEWLQLMRSSGIVNGWEIHRQRTPAVRDNMPTLRRSHNYMISGIYELDDASGSEKTFQALIEAIYVKFRDNHTIGGTCINSDPVQVMDVSVDVIAKTLYHTCELLLVCYERDTYA